MRRTLTILSEAPIPGEVKTELCPPLDDVTAAELQESMFLDSLEKVSVVPDTDLAVAYAPMESSSFFHDAAPFADRFVPQVDKDHSKRMAECFEQLCEPGRSVVVMESDSPTLPVRCLELAFDILASGQVDVVLGPCDDGSCYLIGMNAAHSELIQGIAWNSSGAILKAIERSAELGLDWYLLPTWYRITSPAGLAYLRHEIFQIPTKSPLACHTKAFIRCLSVAGVM